MDMALALADWDGFPNRRAEARNCIANYVEITSGAPRERTEITLLSRRRLWVSAREPHGAAFQFTVPACVGSTS
jgi:hypothetical protein